MKTKENNCGGCRTIEHKGNFLHSKCSDTNLRASFVANNILRYWTRITE